MLLLTLRCLVELELEYLRLTFGLDFVKLIASFYLDARFASAMQVVVCFVWLCSLCHFKVFHMFFKAIPFETKVQ